MQTLLKTLNSFGARRRHFVEGLAGPRGVLIHYCPPSYDFPGLCVLLSSNDVGAEHVCFRMPQRRPLFRYDDRPRYLRFASGARNGI